MTAHDAKQVVVVVLLWLVYVWWRFGLMDDFTFYLLIIAIFAGAVAIGVAKMHPPIE